MSVDLRLGDCLNLIRDIPSETVDVIITDPPYGTATDQRAQWMVGEFSNVMPLVLPELYRVGVPTAALYSFTSWKWMADWIMRASQYFRMQNFLIWDKGRHSGTFGSYSWQYHWEGIYYGIKGPRAIKKYMPDVLRSNEQPQYPMQKPVDVLARLIEASTEPGATVLDPFMGSGSTAIACHKTGRQFIGFEIDPAYFAIAQRRIAEAQLQPSLFALPAASRAGGSGAP